MQQRYDEVLDNIYRNIQVQPAGGVERKRKCREGVGDC
jgi:hypothetical protein